MATPAPPALISTLPDLRGFLSSALPSSTLYLDLEGKNLSRNGTLTIITILVHPPQATSLIDVQTLRDAAFTTANSNGKTLKALLEDPDVPKCLWDVRNDADALWAHHKVRLAGVTDVQLLENASRAGDKTYLNGLDKCVRLDMKLKPVESYRWTQTKKDVRALMRYDVFSRRPLGATTIQYCANDVKYLPALRDIYTKRLDGEWMGKAMEESARRVIEACGPAYEPQSEAKKLGPWGSGLGKKGETWDELLYKAADDIMYELEGDMFRFGRYDDLGDDGRGESAEDAAWDHGNDWCLDK